MNDLGPVRKILGIEIKRDRINEKMFLTQESYIEKWLKVFPFMMLSLLVYFYLVV